MSTDTNYETLTYVLDNYEIEGWAAEFGVYSGESLNLIAQRVPVIGFDSFEGLPEDWRPGFPKGTFDLCAPFGVSAGVLPPRAMIVLGWFADTTPDFPFPPLGLVHIDCDLYSSTATALDAVTGAIRPGTIIVFDEFHGYPGWEDHEVKAWEAFCHRHQVIAEVLAEGVEEKAFRILSIGGSW